MPKIDLTAIKAKVGSEYRTPFNVPVAGIVRNVARAGNAQDFNANHVNLPPGYQSS